MSSNLEFNDGEVSQEINIVVWDNNENYVELSCKNCEQLLIKLIIVDSDHQLKCKYITNCPTCKCSSYPKTVDGRTLYIPNDKYVICNVEVDETITNIILGDKNG